MAAPSDRRSSPFARATPLKWDLMTCHLVTYHLVTYHLVTCYLVTCHLVTRQGKSCIYFMENPIRIMNFRP